MNLRMDEFLEVQKVVAQIVEKRKESMGKAVTIDIRALDHFSGPLDKIKSKVSGLITHIERFNTKMGNISQSLKNAGKAMYDWGMSMKWVAAGVVAAGWAALKAASDYQKLNIQFEVLTGSTAKGAALVEQLRAFELKAGPFAADEIEAAAAKLINLNVAYEQIMPSMKTIATLAAGTGLGLETVAQAYGRMAAQGHANPRSLLLLLPTGLPKVLAEMLSKKGHQVTQDDVMKSAKTIDFALVQQAALYLETTKYKDLLAKIDATTGEVFGDTVELLKRTNAEIGKSIEEATGFNGKLKEMNDWLERMIPNIQKFTKEHPNVVKFGLFVAALVVGLPILAIAFAGLAWAAGLVAGTATGFWLVAAAIAACFTHSEDLLKLWHKLEDAGKVIGYYAEVIRGNREFVDSPAGPSPTKTVLGALDDRTRGLPPAIAGSAEITIGVNSRLFNLSKFSPDPKGVDITLRGPNMLPRNN